jgi:hypothetical protein
VKRVQNILLFKNGKRPFEYRIQIVTGFSPFEYRISLVFEWSLYAYDSKSFLDMYTRCDAFTGPKLMMGLIYGC